MPVDGLENPITSHPDSMGIQKPTLFRGSTFLKLLTQSPEPKLRPQCSAWLAGATPEGPPKKFGVWGVHTLGV